MLLVGKGITFDRRFKHKTAGMVHMKCDMAERRSIWSDATHS
jgi:leucyl aminopeptidase